MEFNKKIYTWDNLCKRGWLGPNRCTLYKSDVESIDHMFVDFSFTQEVLLILGSIFDVHLDWSYLTLSNNLISWFSKDGDLLLLGLLILPCPNLVICLNRESIQSIYSH